MDETYTHHNVFSYRCPNDTWHVVTEVGTSVKVKKLDLEYALELFCSLLGLLPPSKGYNISLYKSSKSTFLISSLDRSKLVIRPDYLTFAFTQASKYILKSDMRFLNEKAGDLGPGRAKLQKAWLC